MTEFKRWQNEIIEGVKKKLLVDTTRRTNNSMEEIIIAR